MARFVLALFSISSTLRMSLGTIVPITTCSTTLRGKSGADLSKVVGDWIITYSSEGTLSSNELNCGKCKVVAKGTNNVNSNLPEGLFQCFVTKTDASGRKTGRTYTGTLTVTQATGAITFVGGISGNALITAFTATTLHVSICQDVFDPSTMYRYQALHQIFLVKTAGPTPSFNPNYAVNQNGCPTYTLNPNAVQGNVEVDIS